MRVTTRIITPVEAEAMALAREEDDEDKRILAKARKEHMMKKAQEASRRAPKSEIEKIFQAEDLLILQKATYLKEQTHDSVKLLNTLGARAAAFTLRDQQIKELETRGDGDALYDTKMNLRMEIDRLEDLKRLEDRETSKKAKRVADRIVLEAQIASRTAVKKQAALKVTAEGEAMLELLRLEAVEEEELEKKKRVKQQVDMKQVMEFNTAAIGIKKQVLETIRLEEEAIATYQLKKAEEAHRLEEEEEARKEEAELRCAKLRSTQERVANDKAALDELRAKRSAESKERRAREAELATEKRRLAGVSEMSKAREMQALHKRRALEQEAILQQQEYTSTMNRVLRDKTRLEQELLKKENQNTAHRESLQVQIDEMEKKRKEIFEKKQLEGRKVREEYDQELVELEEIRTREVQVLIAKGVNPKYLGEMKSIDLAKIRNC